MMPHNLLHCDDDTKRSLYLPNSFHLSTGQLFPELAQWVLELHSVVQLLVFICACFSKPFQIFSVSSCNRVISVSFIILIS